MPLPPTTGCPELSALAIAIRDQLLHPSALSLFVIEPPVSQRAASDAQAVTRRACSRQPSAMYRTWHSGPLFVIEPQSASRRRPNA
jgi:hypothetical protein